MTFQNPLRTAWARGEVTRGAWCTSPSSVVAEAVAASGYDYVCVDLQHGAVDYADAVHMFQAISGQGSVPIARVQANDPALIGRVLDAGALGVVVPLVNTAEEAAQAVAATRYPPFGQRSYGPVRAATVTGTRDARQLEEVVVAVMVETREGLANVEEIAAVPGVDAIYVGPADLALALDLAPAYERPEPEHTNAIERIRQACEDNGITPGVHCVGGEMGARRVAQGFRMTTLVNDLGLVRSAGQAELEIAVRAQGEPASLVTAG